MMKSIQVGSVKLAEFALGAGKRGPKELDEACFAVMDHYLEYGGNTFDSARFYAAGQADEALGRWMKSRKIDRDAVVLVMKGGPGGEEQCVAGMRQSSAPAGMKPGEICLQGKNCSVYLDRDGTVRLRGRIEIDGELRINGEPYKPCSCGDGGDT